MRRCAAALLVLLASAACGDGDELRWHDASASAVDPVNGTIVAETDVYRVVDGFDGRRCAQLTLLDVSTDCIANDYGGPLSTGWGYGGRILRVDDVRVIEFRTNPSTRRFVVRSSRSPSGRPIAPIVAADNAILVWVMEPGEAPWGVQAIAPDGTLGAAASFVGLPGD